MDRGYRDVGRSSLMGDYNDDYRGYSRQGGSSYMDREPPVRDSYMGSSPSGYRSARSGFSSGGGSLDRDIVESLLQQRALQQQLSLRESQLALANSLLQQQQHEYLHKRRMDPRDRLSRDDFKRPRLIDPRSRHRRPSGGRDSSAGGRGSRGSSSHRRNLSSPGGHGRGPSDRSRSPRESYDPEKPTVDDGDAGKNHCRSCNVECKDDEELQKHLASKEHKDRVEHLRNKNNKRHCNICDVELKVSFLQHQRMTFHKKRRIQVTKGCAWCKVTSFKNFTEVLEHRATDKHTKNQKLYDKRSRDSDRSGSESRRGSSTYRKREPIRVELPPELAKYDDKVVTGQACVVAVTGWFCKVCNKFYNNETAAKETHCMSEPHFNNYKKFMYAKLRAKAEAERDAKEKEEEEERKKKEAEEEKKEDDGADDDAKKPTEEGENEEGEQEGLEEMEGIENDGGEEDGGEGVEEEEEEVGGEEEMMEEPEDDYGDEEDVATAEVSQCESSAAEGEEDPSGTGETENAEETNQEVEPMAGEEAIEAEGGEEEEPEETKKVTRGSPARGRGGRGANRARRGRRVAK